MGRKLGKLGKGMTMRAAISIAAFFLVTGCGLSARAAGTAQRQPIRAIYIPLADHYAGIVAYETYREQMKEAEYTIERVKSWPLLRAYFMSGEVDLAYIICPMAMDMFAEKPNFRWVSLLHRDGNALAINELLNKDVNLPESRLERKPDGRVAQAYSKAKQELGRPSECGVPSLLATHTVVLYKYLRDNGKGMNLGVGSDSDVLAIEVAPPKSPSFIKKKNARGIPASFEQSLPWVDVVETKGFGHVAWYSKDVIPWPHGHVECIVIATDVCIRTKTAALKEVISYLHQAGQDIETARRKGGKAMITISDMVRKHIPEHNQEAIIQSLRPDLNVINYSHLNVDTAGLKTIMDLAVEGGILKHPIDIDAFADERFSTRLTDQAGASSYVDYVGVGEKITEAMRKRLEIRISVLLRHAANPLIVRAVAEHNAKGLSLDEIKLVDRQWLAGEQQELADALRDNPVGRFLRDELVGAEHVYTEAFLCDTNGATVGEYPRTSDYWQGDETTFVECYNGGDGKVVVGPLLHDKSTQSYSIHVSVPVRDGGRTTGVLVVGLRNIE